MLNEKAFIRNFWSEVFSELNAHNQTMPDIAETPENFINRLDEIAVEKGVSSFGYREHIGGNMGSVGATMTVECDTGRIFQIDIRAELRFDNNTKLKIVYVELSEVHQNSKDFLINIFFQKLPYTELEKLLDSIQEFNKKFDEKLMELRKQQKMNQLTLATIKSLLTEKFKNTGYEWEIFDFENSNDPSFSISLTEKNSEISRLIVSKSDMVEKIMNWKVFSSDGNTLK